LEKKVAKKRFNEQWTLKQRGEVGDDLHLAIKANLPLVAMVYHATFCWFSPSICKYNMQLAITKCKVRQDGQDALHMALIEPRWVYKRLMTSSFVG
jgi:hypothetical protein